MRKINRKILSKLLYVGKFREQYREHQEHMYVHQYAQTMQLQYSSQGPLVGIQHTDRSPIHCRIMNIIYVLVGARWSRIMLACVLFFSSLKR